MATIFLTYKLEERKFAEQLQRELEALGHTIRIDTNAVMAGSGWRDSLMRALMESDAVVALISERSIQSPFVVSEIGAARAFGQTPKKMALLPILIGDIPIPQFIQDLYIIRLRGMDPSSFKLVASDIDKAIQTHIAQIEDKSLSPKLFISHKHKDKEIVSALIDVLQSAFMIDRKDIRCTSVNPYRLPVGERTPDRLKQEIKNAQAVIGILTPDSKDSSYVLFELGAAWSHNVLTCPLLARGGSIYDIPDPIKDINPLSLEDEENCAQFIDDLKDYTTLKQRQGVGGDVSNRIKRLALAAKEI